MSSQAFRRLVFQGKALLLLLGICLLLESAAAGAQEHFHLALMQSQSYAAAKFAPLQAYLRRNGIEVQIVLAEDYPAAARMFAAGKIDGMFSGSAVAGAMIIKDIAYPLLRPVNREGYSQYWAVVLAPKGAPRFSATADYFRGKRVACCALASAGELFLRSIPGAEKGVRALRLTESHEAALVALARGEADVAIVKNLVWENLQAQYPAIEAVGIDAGRNPNNTLIISRRADPEVVAHLAHLLLGLSGDPGREAALVRAALNIQRHIPTTVADFGHTLQLLETAGIGAEYDFRDHPSPPSTDAAGDTPPDLINYP